MGLLSNQHRSQKNVNKLLQEDFENRMREFVKEYTELTKKYRCVHKPIFEFIAGGALGMVPKNMIIDATELLKQEEEAKKESDKLK